MFQQHKFAATFMGVPTIQIREDVLRDMWHVTDVVQMEVGWFCTVKNMGGNVFLLDGMYLPTQECHGATSEITPAGEAKMMHDIITAEAAAGVEAASPDHKLNRLDAWFHSHVDMETNPSAQDLDQMEKFRQTGRPYFIRGIVNKKGKISLAYYDSRSSLKGFRVEDCPWEIVAVVDDGRRARWQSEISSKVSRLGGYTTPYTPPQGGYGGGYGDPDYGYPRGSSYVPPPRRVDPLPPVNVTGPRRRGLAG